MSASSRPDRKSFMALASGAAAAAVLPFSKPAAAVDMSGAMLPAADRRADADMKRVLEKLMEFYAPPLPSITPRIARELPSIADAARAVLSAERLPVVEPVKQIQHRVIDGPGGPMLLRIYIPRGTGTLPVLMYYHGGGFVIANLDMYDASPRALANGSGAIVVSVAYRQAPEFPFPAAPDDALAAYLWVTKHAAEFGGDPRRVALSGESAGGCLAAIVALRARDLHLQAPLHQLLIYPVTTFAAATPPPSYADNMDTLPLATPDLAWFKKYYLTKASDASNPLASPLLAKDLSGLPPATIINAEIDPLLDDGAAYAKRLQAANVSVHRTVYTGVTHEFFGMVGAVAKSKQAMTQATQALKASFAR